MNKILEMLHSCAERYRKSEEERVAKIKEEAKRRKVEEKKKKPRKRKTADEKKTERLRNTDNARKYFREREPDPYVERAKEYTDGGKSLYPKPERIPLSERAECFTPWCMHNVNGHCVHRECYIEKKRKNETVRR